MVDLATALATKLLTPAPGGQEVTQTGIEIRGAGGGLSESLAFDAVQPDIGDEFYIVIRVRVAGIRYDEIKDSDCLKQVAITKPSGNGAGTIIPDEVIGDYMESYRERIALEREKAANIQRLPFHGSDDEDDFGHERVEDDDPSNEDAE